MSTNPVFGDNQPPDAPAPFDVPPAPDAVPVASDPDADPGALTAALDVVIDEAQEALFEANAESDTTSLLPPAERRSTGALGVGRAIMDMNNANKDGWS